MPERTSGAKSRAYIAATAAGTSPGLRCSLPRLAANSSPERSGSSTSITTNVKTENNGIAFNAASRVAPKPAAKPKVYAPARARWRRCLAFSLALRLLALIVLLDLLVCLTTASNLVQMIQTRPIVMPGPGSALRAARGQALVPGIHGNRQDVRSSS